MLLNLNSFRRKSDTQTYHSGAYNKCLALKVTVRVGKQVLPRNIEAFRRSPDGHENLFRDVTRHVVYRCDIIQQVTIVTIGIEINISRQAFQLYLQEDSNLIQ